MKEKEIRTLDEIKKPDTRYFLIDSRGKRTGQWVLIEFDKRLDEFELHRKIYRSQLFDFETQGNYVKTWKTFKGALRFAKRKYEPHLITR